MILSVITPIGPGHEVLAEEAIASARAAYDHYPGPFRALDVIAMPDPNGMGRSRTRNLAVKRASPTGWTFYLDADDLMAPDALWGFETALRAQPDLDAIWGTISCFRGLEKPRVRPAQVYPTTYSDLIRAEPTGTLQNGFFVKAEIAKAEPWNEGVEQGEDWDMFLRLWSKYRCAKSPKVFMFNRRGQHSAGPKHSDGRQWRIAVTKMLRIAQVKETRGIR